MEEERRMRAGRCGPEVSHLEWHRCTELYHWVEPARQSVGWLMANPGAHICTSGARHGCRISKQQQRSTGRNRRHGLE